jgi:DNA-binding MarR family transcriptional regulator
MSLSNKQYVQINQALFTLAHAYESRRARDEQRNPAGLLLSDRAVLMVLGQFGSMNSRQLSHAMDVNPGTISVYVQRLVGKGLIEKMQDEADRRNWWLSLTQAGRAAFEETIAGTVAYTRDFLSALDEAEQQTLRRLLLKVSHSLGFDWQ